MNLYKLTTMMTTMQGMSKHVYCSGNEKTIMRTPFLTADNSSTPNGGTFESHCRRISISVLAILLCCQSIYGQVFDGIGHAKGTFDERLEYEFNITDKTAKVYFFNGNTSELEHISIPASETFQYKQWNDNLNAYTEETITCSVVGILGHVFQYCKKLASITLPNTLLEIGDEAFVGCAFSNVDFLPQSIKKIGTGAFLNNKLKDVSIPNGVDSIGDYAFGKSLERIHIGKSLRIFGSGYGERGVYNNLECISINPDNPYLSVCDSVLFNKDKSLLLRYPACRKAERYTLPESVDSIAPTAFNGSKYLQHIDSFAHVKTIDYATFENCIALREIDLKGVSSVSSWGFLRCSNLDQVTLRCDIHLNAQAFWYCDNLKTLIIDENVKNIWYADNVFPSTIVSYAEVPPVLKKQLDWYPDVKFEGKTVYVPEGSYELYKASPYWEKCTIIAGIPTDLSAAITATVPKISRISEFYNLYGHKTDKQIKGLNIIRMSDGTVRKVMMK